MLEAGREGRGP